MKLLLVASSLILIICFSLSSVEGLSSKSIVIASSGQIVSSNLQSKKYVATLLITWNEYYFGRDPNWGQSSLFTPELGSYDNSNTTIIDQQIRWMDEAGVDICFVTVAYSDAVDWMNRFLSKADELNSKVKFAVYFNGGNFEHATNRVLEGINSLASANIFNHPRYFKWKGVNPVVSGFLGKPALGWHIEYWIEVKEKYPNLSIWAHGWHPNYWSSLDGVVDAMCVFDSASTAQGQVTYYNTCETHPLPIHMFSVTPGFDNSGIGGTLKLNRNNGQTFIDCWNKISTLATAPDIVWVGAWNEYGECSGIEPISASRSTTTGAFGDLYLNLTHEYGNLFKSGKL